MKTKFNRFFAMIMCAVMTFTVAPLSGFFIEAYAATYSGKCGDNLNWSLDTSTGVFKITGTGSMWDFDNQNVPDPKIKDWYNCIDEIKDISFSNGVTGIGEFSFRDCKNLKSVSIPAGITYIGKGAFTGCDSLEEIKVDPKNKHYVSDDSGVLFNKEKTELMQYPTGSTRSTYTIPKSVTNLIYNYEEMPYDEFNAFTGCKNLSRLDVEKGNDVYFVDTCGVLFMNCESGNSVSSGKSERYKVLLYYPSANKRTSYTIPQGIPYVCDDAVNSPYLENLIIPESVISLGHGAFGGCTNLKSVALPKKVPSYGYGVFGYCQKLKDVYYPGSEREWNNSYAKVQDMDEFHNFSNTTIHYNAEINYEVVEETEVNESNAEDNVDYTFVEENDKIIITDCDETATGEVVIPENINNKPVLEIADEAFKDCLNINFVDLPSTIEKIGDAAFENSGIVSIIVPENVEVIPNRVFYKCVELISIEIPGKVAKIEAEAFGECEKLEDVYYLGEEEDWNRISMDDETKAILARVETHYKQAMESDTKRTTVVTVLLIVVEVFTVVCAVIIAVLIYNKKKKAK